MKINFAELVTKFINEFGADLVSTDTKNPSRARLYLRPALASKALAKYASLSSVEFTHDDSGISYRIDARPAGTQWQGDGKSGILKSDRFQLVPNAQGVGDSFWGLTSLDE